MKRFAHFLSPMDSYISWQVPICPHDPGLKAPADWVIEMHHLRKSMNSRIGSAGASCPHGYTSNLLKRCLQCLLHGRHAQVRLRLPAMVVTAVVLNPRRNAGARRQ